MKKHISAALAAILCTGGAMAQEGGAFVGVSFGQGKTKLDTTAINTTILTTEDQYKKGSEYDIIVTKPDGTKVVETRLEPDTYIPGTTTTNVSRSSENFTADDTSFGVIAGYRHFVLPSLAVRGYGEYEHKRTKVKSAENSQSANYMAFTLGVDAIYYFNRSDVFQIGAFAGIGAAYSRYPSKLTGLDKNLNAFGLASNVGLHADIVQHHGIDVGAKFLTNNVSGSRGSYEVDVKHQPAFFVRYMFQF
ncbi:MAG: outer membrane protein [Helicobacter sp.]|nr:outer membrane protein [Helicobacter sp.]